MTKKPIKDTANLEGFGFDPMRISGAENGYVVEIEGNSPSNASVRYVFQSFDGLVEFVRARIAGPGE
jgi:hypothetical protein